MGDSLQPSQTHGSARCSGAAHSPAGRQSGREEARALQPCSPGVQVGLTYTTEMFLKEHVCTLTFCKNGPYVDDTGSTGYFLKLEQELERELTVPEPMSGTEVVTFTYPVSPFKGQCIYVGIGDLNLGLGTGTG